MKRIMGIQKIKKNLFHLLSKSSANQAGQSTKLQTKKGWVVWWNIGKH